MEITLSIKGQELKILGKQPNLYHGSIGVLYIKFCDVNFDASLVKTVRFKTDKSDWYTADVIDGRVRVPCEVISVGGFDVAVGGYDTKDGELLRFLPTNSVHIDVSENGYGEPDAPLLTEETRESIIAKLDKKADTEFIKQLLPKRTVNGTVIRISDHIKCIEVPGYKVFGNSIQNDRPTPKAPVKICSSGEQVTDARDEHYGKYHFTIQTDEEKYNVYLDKPLMSVENSVDYIDFETKQAVSWVGEIRLTGSERIYPYSQTGKYKGFAIECLPFDCMRAPGMCNYYNVSRDEKKDQDSIWIGVGNKIVYFINNSFFDENAEDYGAENFGLHISESYKNGNPVTIYYQLPAPRIDTIELPTIMMSDDDDIQISTDKTMGGSVELTYYQDINKVIADLKSAHSA